MDSSTVIWVLVAIVVALIVIAAVVALSKRAAIRKEEKHRERAGELREQAAATQETIRRHQAELDATEARAREMRAEADRKRAEAARIEADLTDRRSTVNEHVQRRGEVLAEADEMDPDVHREASSDADVPADEAAADRGEREAQHRA
jgi:hypothetical protein